MHKLNRPAAAPACLANYHHGRHNWSAVSPADKDQIRGSLKTMQQNRCAYCEQALRDDACHIEHFRQRGRYPQGTFQWSNLYLSCNRESTCGKHKDKQHYAPADLLDPCTDNPDDYLRFYSDGQIRPRADLAAPNQHRAAETIRVLPALNWLPSAPANCKAGYRLPKSCKNGWNSTKPNTKPS